jgi:xanthine dehydrogenase YagT iron-sulfur-binding subunit
METGATGVEDRDAGITRRQLLAGAAAAGAAAAMGSLVGCQTTAPPAGPPTTESAESPGETQAVTLRVNGTNYTVNLESRVTLLDALRENLGLTGSKKGCDHGQCGACTVLIDGRRVNSCLQLAIANQGREIVTIEGLSGGDQLHPMQAAFIEHDAFQCGYCTPGQICSAVGLLNEAVPKTDDEIRERMSGNICRCGAYVNIVAAVRAVAGTKA